MKSSKHQTYVSPFCSRYASKEMMYLHSPDYRYTTYRKLWIALARAEKKLGLKITDAQIRQMQNASEKIDFEKVRKYEKKFRHDVMAHLHTFADECPKARPIIHLGATSSYVADNADLIILWESLELLLGKLYQVIRKMAALADKTKRVACLSYTHLQPAQPTTVGKRISLWLQDFIYDFWIWEHHLEKIPFLGAKGATGTQSSFLNLFEGDEKKVKKLDELISFFMGFTRTFTISSQTYPRKFDLLILNSLEAFAAGAHKMATDIRLLSHMGEMREHFSKDQVGSSAMPFKKNPVYSERICGISRFLISISQNPAYTLATQWLERSLDDSSNRRLSISEALLSADVILNLLNTVVEKLDIDQETIDSNLQKHLGPIAMENILMDAVKRGGDRQKLHEKLRKIGTGSQKSSLNLIEKISKDKDFKLSKKEIETLLDPKNFIGRAPSQVTEFLKEDVMPVLDRFKGQSSKIAPVEF